MTVYDLVAIVNLLEDKKQKDYGFALYKEEYELLRTANLENTLVVVNARGKDRRVLGNVKEIIYVFLTIFLYLLKCPQSLIL